MFEKPISETPSLEIGAIKNLLSEELVIRSIYMAIGAMFCRFSCTVACVSNAGVNVFNTKSNI